MKIIEVKRNFFGPRPTFIVENGGETEELTTEETIVRFASYCVSLGEEMNNISNPKDSSIWHLHHFADLQDDVLRLKNQVTTLQAQVKDLTKKKGNTQKKRPVKKNPRNKPRMSAK